MAKPVATAPADPAAGTSLPAVSTPAITHEDMDRARDRRRVWLVRIHKGSFVNLRLLWLLVGPGILVMLGENDGPSMLSYAATGARYGIGFFIPFIILTFVMALVVQEMTVRLGAVTHRGHAELIYDRFGPFWGRFSMIDLMIGNFLTLITEFIAIRAGLGFFGIPPWAAVLGTLAVLYIALMTHRYWTWERITLAAAMFNLIFIPVALLAHPQWGSDRSRAGELGAASRRREQRHGHDSACRHRRHGYSLDALFPAERYSGQGVDSPRYSLRPDGYALGRSARVGRRYRHRDRLHSAVHPSRERSQS